MPAALLVPAVLALTAVPAQATTILGDPVLLSDLLDASIIVGDKHFTDFSYAATGDMPSATNVNVIPIQDDDGNFGIRFQGAFVDLVSSAGGSDALIGYTVSVTDSRLSIIDAHLAGNPTLLGDRGSISVVETFDFDPELRLVIFDDEGGSRSVDSVDFAPVQSIQVTKDILGFALPPDDADGPGTVTLSFVDQTFSQTAVPEPATLLLLGSGLAGLVRMGRRPRAS